MYAYTRLALLFASLLLITGCKLVIFVSPGGEVVSLSGQNDCGTESTCIVDIDADDFSETFTAIPDTGYEFDGWQNGDDFQCAGSTSTSCELSNLGTSGFGQFVLDIFNSDSLYYLMPRFRFVGIDSDGDGIRDGIDPDDDNDGLLDELDPCPFNPNLACGGDLVMADGKTWYQPDLFTGLTWQAIAAVCPGGVCSGVLNGFDLSGYTWATGAQVQSLFDSYGPFTASAGCPGGVNFLFDGWRKTNSTIAAGTGYDLAAFISDSTNSVALLNAPPSGCGTFTVPIGMGDLFDIVGAWFFQTP